MVKTVGKVSIQPSGQWVKANTYKKLQLVSNLGSSYLAIQPVPANTEIDNTSYWMMIASKGDKGNTGKSIQTITKTGTVGLVDTYTILYSDLTTSTFTVNNGNGVTGIEVEKTGTAGNVDTYTMTITMASGEPYVSTFTITNGEDGDVQASAIAEPYDSTVAYKIGNLLTYLGKQYEVTGDDGVAPPVGTLPTDTNYFTERPVSEIIEMIKTGEITVGKANLANNFDSKMVLTDNSGYLYRTTGGSLEVGEQNRVKKIVGASVPIIQLITSRSSAVTEKGVTSTPNGDGSYTITGGNTSESNAFIGLSNTTFSIIAGHKYLIRGCGTGLQTTEAFVYISSPYYVFKKADDIVNFGSSSSTAIMPYLVVATGYTFETPLKIKPQIIDLTATFGTTVANRLYALEQAQAGTGIAKAKEILVKDYYPYNVTAFTHTKTSGKVNNGFNQFNITKLADVTSWSKSGDYYKGPISKLFDFYGAGKGFIELAPNYSGQYQIYCEGYVGASGTSTRFKFAYTDGTTEGVASFDTTNAVKVATSNASKVVKAIYFDFGSGSNNNLFIKKLCISQYWDGERDGDYEDYVEWNYPVEDIELKGILSLDAQDNWVADGDEYLPSGVVDENIIAIKLDELTYSYVTTSTVSPFFQANIASLGLKFQGVFASTIYNARCPKYNITKRNTDFVDKCLTFDGNANTTQYIQIKDLDYTDPTDFKASLSGLYLLAPLATPTSTTADSYTELQNDSNWGTEKWIDTRDVPMPVFSTCEYIPDLKAKLETAPESPEEDGDYIMHRENGLNSYGSLSTWLSANGYNKLQDLLTAFGANGMVGGTLRNVLANAKSISFRDTNCIDLGNLTWSYRSATGEMYASAQPTDAEHTDSNNIASAFCTGYMVVSRNTVGQYSKALSIHYSDANYITVHDTAYTDAATFKEAMKGQLLAYKKEST